MIIYKTVMKTASALIYLNVPVTWQMTQVWGRLRKTDYNEFTDRREGSSARAPIQFFGFSLRHCTCPPAPVNLLEFRNFGNTSVSSLSLSLSLCVVCLFWFFFSYQLYVFVWKLKEKRKQPHAVSVIMLSGSRCQMKPDQTQATFLWVQQILIPCNCW